MDIVINRMKHWAHRLYPKLPFDDVTKQITHLGKKMQIQTNVKKIRLGLDIDPYFDNAITEKENKENLNSDDEAPENEEDRIERYLRILDIFCTQDHFCQALLRFELPLLDLKSRVLLIIP